MLTSIHRNSKSTAWAKHASRPQKKAGAVARSGLVYVVCGVPVSYFTSALQIVVPGIIELRVASEIPISDP